MFIQAELRIVARIPAVVSQVVSKFGKLDGAFNNAGVSGGAILFNASVMANIGAVGTSIYSASKGGTQKKMAH